MDAIDRKILAVLQAEGRLTVTELAQRIALSVAPCHRRLRELERTGAIRGYRAVIDPEAIGLGFEVLVQVTMDREDASTITQFERALAGIAEVRQAERLFGDPDYLVRVATASLAPTRRCGTRSSRAARCAATHLHHRDETRRSGPALPHLKRRAGSGLRAGSVTRADRGSVAMEDLGLVLVPGGRGAVGVQDQSPAPPVNHHLMMERAQQDGVLDGGLPTVLLTRGEEARRTMTAGVRRRSSPTTAS